jgi:hypothetical protein
VGRIQIALHELKAGIRARVFVRAAGGSTDSSSPHAHFLEDLHGTQGFSLNL